MWTDESENPDDQTAQRSDNNRRRASQGRLEELSDEIKKLQIQQAQDDLKIRQSKKEIQMRRAELELLEANKMKRQQALYQLEEESRQVKKELLRKNS